MGLFGYSIGFILVVLTGCKKLPPSETHCATYEKAQRLKREGRPQEALLAFLEAIDTLKQAPASHLEAGLLYLNEAQDPIEAIHHFRRFLQQAPKAQQAELVRELILKAQKECIRQLPMSPAEDSVTQKELWGQLQQARKDNVHLQSTIMGLRERLERSEHKASAEAPALRARQTPRSTPPALLIRTHTVEAGDTLMAISKKAYGTTQRWQDILKANPGLKNPQDLKIGQQLELP